MERWIKGAIVTLAVGASISFIASLLFLIENCISDATADQYHTVFQICTANWPAAWPNIFDRRSFSFSFVLLWRLSLILSPIFFLSALLWGFYKVKDRTMQVKDAIALRDIAVEAAFL